MSAGAPPPGSSRSNVPGPRRPEEEHIKKKSPVQGLGIRVTTRGDCEEQLILKGNQFCELLMHNLQTNIRKTNL